jgi:hypothetical protein
MSASDQSVVRSHLNAEVVIERLAAKEKELIARANKQREMKREFIARSLEDESIGVWMAMCLIKEMLT